MVSTLILPADTPWTETYGTPRAKDPEQAAAPAAAQIEALAKVLRGTAPVILLLGHAASANPEAVAHADRIAQVTGAQVLSRDAPTRIEAGAGTVPLEPVPHAVDAAVEVIDHTEDAEATAAGEAVGDEVQAPTLVRPLRDRHRRPGPERPLAATALAHGEALFAVDAVELLPVHFPALALQKQMQAPVSEPPPLSGEFSQPFA